MVIQRLTVFQIVSATAGTVRIVAAGSSMIGFGAGCILVSYAGIAELLPNKYRYELLLEMNKKWTRTDMIQRHRSSMDRILYHHPMGR
jgi:hypothetical protein